LIELYLLRRRGGKTEERKEKLNSGHECGSSSKTEKRGGGEKRGYLNGEGDDLQPSLARFRLGGPSLILREGKKGKKRKRGIGEEWKER